jgi:hypothetical protein
MASDYTARAYMCVTTSLRAFVEPSQAEPKKGSARLEKFEQGSIDRAELWESSEMARSWARISELGLDSARRASSFRVEPAMSGFSVNCTVTTTAGIDPSPDANTF